MHNKIEYCCVCDEATGKAGISEDSLYDNNAIGPYCEACYYLVKMEEDEQATTKP